MEKDTLTKIYHHLNNIIECTNCDACSASATIVKKILRDNHE